MKDKISAKDILIKPISSKDATAFVKKFHYSGKVAANSNLHFGAFLDNKLHGVMQFGSPIDKRNVIGLVKDTKWHDFLELNRMAFDDILPKNSESRSLSIAFKIIKKRYPNIEWILTFADATQCGDGTIYRAAGFKLLKIKINSTIVRLRNGDIVAKHGTAKHDYTNAKLLSGYQIKYIYFLNKDAEKRLTVPELDYSEIKRMNAQMYRGYKNNELR